MPPKGGRLRLDQPNWVVFIESQQSSCRLLDGWTEKKRNDVDLCHATWWHLIGQRDKRPTGGITDRTNQEIIGPTANDKWMSHPAAGVSHPGQQHYSDPLVDGKWKGERGRKTTKKQNNNDHPTWMVNREEANTHTHDDSERIKVRWLLNARLNTNCGDSLNKFAFQITAGRSSDRHQVRTEESNYCPPWSSLTYLIAHPGDDGCIPVVGQLSDGLERKGTSRSDERDHTMLEVQIGRQPGWFGAGAGGIAGTGSGEKTRAVIDIHFQNGAAKEIGVVGRRNWFLMDMTFSRKCSKK